MAVITGREGAVWLGDTGGDDYDTPGVGNYTEATLFTRLDGWRLITRRKFTKVTARDYSYVGTVPGRYSWRVECRAYQDSTAAWLNGFFNEGLLSVALEASTTIAEASASGSWAGKGWISDIEISIEAQGMARLMMVIEGSDMLTSGFGALAVEMGLARA